MISALNNFSGQSLGKIGDYDPTTHACGWVISVLNNNRVGRKNFDLAVVKGNTDLPLKLHSHKQLFWKAFWRNYLLAYLAGPYETGGDEKWEWEQKKSKQFLVHFASFAIEALK